MATEQKNENKYGEVAEWSNAPHSKCGLLERVTWVRIPPSPPGQFLIVQCAYSYKRGDQ